MLNTLKGVAMDEDYHIYVEAEGKDFRARMVSDATLPYTGEGRSMDAAVNSLREMLKDALETILEAESLSPAMEKQKAGLLKVFGNERA